MGFFTPEQMAKAREGLPEDAEVDFPWQPEGVKWVVDFGGGHYIGGVDETTVLKYPRDEGDTAAVRTEAQMLKRLGKHPRIVEYKGDHKDGILLELVPKRSLQVILYDKTDELSKQVKMRIARETAEGVAHAHRCNVLICDIHVRNILLDNELHVKLCDFQGRLLGPNGEELAKGHSVENADSFMPRSDICSASFKTDIFALGTAIYEMMTSFHIQEGEHVFKQLEDKIEEFWASGSPFPSLDAEMGGDVVHKCWGGKYESADEVVKDLMALEDLMQEGEVEQIQADQRDTMQGWIEKRKVDNKDVGVTEMDMGEVEKETATA